MFVKLTKEQYHLINEVKELFSFPLINAVLNNVQEGVVYLDTINNPKLIFVLHKSNFSVVYALDTTYNYSHFIDFIEFNEDIPKYFHVYDVTSNLVETVEQNSNFNSRLRKRVQLKYLKKAINDFLFDPDKHETHFSEINDSNFASLNDFGADIEEKFWSSKENFLKNGLGVYISYNDNIPISVCYSACVADNTAEIDIITKPQHQRKGLAKLTTAKFIQMALQKNIIPNWDCFEDNVASLKTAQDVGFSIIKQYEFLSIYKK